jgi:dephospho-CoA kinase
LSGPIAAGKTTAGDFLKLSGFHYGRFSLVLADILRERGIKPSRESLQQIGEEVNKNPGQRWLGQELVRRLPDDGDLVIDGLRFPEDHAFLVETFGPAFLHIHIDAPSTIRLERSISAGGTREEFFQAISRPTEANVSKLTSLAHFIVPNINGSESFLSEIRRIVEEHRGSSLICP